jgi:methylglutaconyl-CoA hydratase
VIDEPLVRRTVRRGVATLTLNSPRNRNALSRRLLAALEAELIHAIDTPDVRAIVLTGAGPAFCAGADLKEQRDADPADPPLARLPELMQLMWGCPQPIVGRLNGPARAGGVGLLASCDLVVAPADATFAFTEVRIGVVPAVISVPLSRRLAPQAMHRLFLTGETFDAATAQRIGLVDEVADPAALDAAVTRVVDELLRGAPEALAITKSLAHTIGRLPPPEGFAQVAALSAERFASAEGQEGMRAFAEKRDPSWVPA